MEEIKAHPQNSNLIETVIIRPLTKADLPALEWDGEFIHFRRVFEDVYKKIEKGTVKAWVAVSRDERMIGQVFLQLSSERTELADGLNRAYLYSLRVRQPWRNQGIGSKLISILEDTLRNMNFTSLTLNVARTNESAIRLYNCLGFQIVAREEGIWSYPDHKGIWRTINEPSWRMEKKLQS